jgi:hypothetical protein
MKIPEKNMDRTKESRGDVRDMSSCPPFQLQSADTLRRPEVAAVMGSIAASSDIVESEGRKMKRF